MQFNSQNPAYEYLRKKWIAKHRDIADNFLDKHSKHLKNLTLGGLGGLMVLTTPGMSTMIPGATVSASTLGIEKGEDKNMLLAQALKADVPQEMRKLSPAEETKIAKILTEKFGFPVTAEMEGIKLNRSYGLIGGEQHLYRYPGDNLYLHAENAADWAMYGPAGVAPGLGAWGYFAPSKEAFSSQDRDRERYYIAVQTFLAPGFAENVAKYRDFFKYCKMLLVNPQSGQAVVADIADAGPAEWTGKHLGGSPEVMQAIGLASGPRKGPVLYFFIDGNEQIPLGPINPKNK